ncbi:MAG: hypothetical protein LBS83_00270 [Holosporales bacterium]|nr:hypothetical protein [Holosporales bacterium]
MSKTDKNQNKNKEPIYCINREISEEEAILSLAEGWSTAEPPTQEMLDNSYYKKAFERLKEGKLTWNWAAALGGPLWLLFHKVNNFYLLLFSLLIPLLFPFLAILGNSVLRVDVEQRFRKKYYLWKNYKGKSWIFTLIVTANIVFLLNILPFLSNFLQLEDKKKFFLLFFLSFSILPILGISQIDKKYILKSHDEYAILCNGKK